MIRWALLLGVAVCLVAPVVGAEEPSPDSPEAAAAPTVVLLPFTGDFAQKARHELGKQLARSDTVVTRRDTSAGEDELALSGAVGPSDEGLTLTLTLSDETGRELGTAALSGKNSYWLIVEIQRRGADRVTELLENRAMPEAPSKEDEPADTEAAPEASEAPPPDAEEAELGADEESEWDDDWGFDDAEATTEEEEPPPAAPLELTARLFVSQRHLRYTDDIDSALRTYTNDAYPSTRIGARWFPAAHAYRGPAAHFGVSLAYERGLPRSSQQGLGAETDEMYAGALARLPIPIGRVAFSAGAGQHRFSIEEDTAAGQLVPSVRYGFVRVGIGVRLHLSDWLIEGALGNRFVLSGGQIDSDEWFGNADIGGLDGSLSAGRVLGDFHLFVGARYYRYFMALDPDPADPPPEGIAAGASDDYPSAFLGARYVMPSIDQ